VSWLPGVCLDRDGDSYGKGPSCVGSDCDDSNPKVSPSARETCNGVDDDCDGETDDILEQDTPRCEHYKGVCKLARKPTCAGGVWLDCETDSYGADYEKDEVTCDMQDNDCDGAIDEGCACMPDTTRKCDAPDQGECDAGTQRCQRVAVGGEWSDTCTGVILPVSEQCNLLDDDCDGETDEDFDKQTDRNHCGQCNHACGANSRCHNGNCLPNYCPQGFFPAATDGLPVCISTLQSAATPCKAFANCAALAADGKVGYGGDGLILPDPLPPDLDEPENPIIVWTRISGDIGSLSAHYVCLNTTPEADGEGEKICSERECLITPCNNCVPEDCPASLTNCGECGCKLRYWGHIEIQ
jgi:hypothetical protein